MTTLVEFLFATSGTIAAAIHGLTDGGASFAALALIGLGGLLAGVSPSGLTAGLAVVAQFQPPDRRVIPSDGVALASAFSLGMLTALAVVGMLAAWAGSIVVGLGLAKWLPLLPLLMGLNRLGVIRWRWFRSIAGIGALVVRRVDAFWLGLPFGIATSPCALPVLLTVLTVAAAKGQAAFAMLGLLAFGVGRSVPVLALGFAGDRAQALPHLHRVAPYVRRAAAGVVVVVSLYFLTLGTELVG